MLRVRAVVVRGLSSCTRLLADLSSGHNGKADGGMNGRRDLVLAALVARHRHFQCSNTAASTESSHAYSFASDNNTLPEPQHVPARCWQMLLTRPPR